MIRTWSVITEFKEKDADAWDAGSNPSLFQQQEQFVDDDDLGNYLKRKTMAMEELGFVLTQFYVYSSEQIKDEGHGIY